MEFLSLIRRRSSARNVPSGKERGEMDVFLAMWDVGPPSQHHCIKDILPMRIFPYLSDRREIKETDVKYVETFNLKALTR